MPLQQIFPGPGATSSNSDFKVDIIAVHGLNPFNTAGELHALNTWRTPDNDEGRLWLRDDLPKWTPGARIFLYQYNSQVAYGCNHETFIDTADQFLEALRIKRENTERPLIFLAHSLGGLLVEQALVNAHNNTKYTSIQAATTGLAFFGTPHHGGSKLLVAIGGVVSKLALSVGFKRGDNILKTLKSDSTITRILTELWRHQTPRYNIISFWGNQDNIVPRESSRFGLPGNKENIVMLNGDHHTICRFGRSRVDENNLEIVQSNITDLYNAALEADIPGAINRPISIEQLLQANAIIRSDIERIVQASTASISSEVKAINTDVKKSWEAIISQFLQFNNGLNQVQAINSRLEGSSKQLLSRLEEWQEFKKAQNTNLEEAMMIFNNLNRSDNQRFSDEVLVRLMQIQRALIDLADQRALFEKPPTVSRSPVYFIDANIHRELGNFLLYLARGVCQLLISLWLRFPRVRHFFLVMGSIVRSPALLLRDNIRFEDVLGRVRSLPYEQFRHWEVFSAMLRCEFKGKPGESYVLEGRYQIITIHERHRLVDPILWEELVSPGSKIVMAVVFDYLALPGTLCAKCGGSFESRDGRHDRNEGLVYKRCRGCSFVVSQSPGDSKSLQKPDTVKITTKETNDNNRITTLSPLAQERLCTTGESSTASGSEGIEDAFKVFRRIHVFKSRIDMQTPLALTTTMAQSLPERHRSGAGFLYVSRNLEFPSTVHIGSTYRDPKLRIHGMKRHCGFPVVQVMDVLSRKVSGLPRLEKLVHLNLMSTRRPRLCQGCGHRHSEEFEVSDQVALKTIERWRKWMEAEPYDERGELKDYWKRQIFGHNSPLTVEDVYAVLSRA